MPRWRPFFLFWGHPVNLVAKIWQFIVCCAHFHTMFLPRHKQKQDGRHLAGVAITLAWAMLGILAKRQNIPFRTHSPSFLWLSMIGEKTIQAGRLRQPYHISHQNLRSQNLPLTFFPHMPAACHSTEWSSCTKIEECTIKLSQSALAGKWESKRQKQMLLWGWRF